MRIVHVLTRLLRAGSEENTVASCRAQAAAGHEVHLVHGREFDPRWYEANTGGFGLVAVDSLVHPLAPGRDAVAFRDLRRLFRRLRPDVVHTHQSKAGIIGRLAAKAEGVPCIVHGVHIVPFVNVGPGQRGVYLAAERIAARVTDAFIDVSRGMRDVCVAAGVGRPNDHHVVHSGFDLDRFAAADWPEDWREILGVAEGEAKPPVVLMLAAFEPRKRHCEFLEAFTAVVERHPDVRLILAGEGPHRAAVDAAVVRLNLEESVRVLGYRTDPERLIAFADLCTLVSTREGLPRVVMQYLVGGKTCVVSDLPGLDEVVQNGVNGIVTPSDDLASAAAAISRLLDDRAEHARLTAGALLSDLSSWRVEHMTAEIERVYGLAAEHRRG